jgi:hypothetical protein
VALSAVMSGQINADWIAPRAKQERLSRLKNYSGMGQRGLALRPEKNGC